MLPTDAATTGAELPGDAVETVAAAVGTGEAPLSLPEIRPALFEQLPRLDEPGFDEHPGLPRDAEVELTVELGQARGLHLQSLGPGSVVELDRLAGETVDILVGGRVIARGEAVVVDETSYGVRVTDVVSPELRIRLPR